MSLINDMLKDLDHDQPNREPTVPSSLMAPKGRQERNLRRFFLPGLAVTAIAYAAIIEWNLLGVMPEKKAAVTDIPQPIALNSKWLKENSTQQSATPVGIEKPVTISSPVTDNAPASAASTPASVVDDASLADAQVEPSTHIVDIYSTDETITATQATVGAEHNIANETQFDAIERLLHAAEVALERDRLTTPAGDNAYQLYKSVLVIDPENTAALSGIERIRKTYLDWIDNALSEQKFAAAQNYLQKAKSVGVTSDLLDSYQIPSADAHAAPNSNDPVESVIALPAATIKPATVPNDEVMAERLRQEGSRREQDARRLLAQSPGATQTAVALADLYAEQRSIADLRRLVEELNNHAAQNYVTGQLLQLTGQDQQALEALTVVELSGVAERQRMRLMAGLQQKAGQYATAMQLYASLVTTSPDNVADWLGLAVSADKGKLAGTALNAYEKVLLLRHPDPRVMQYARQRQQDLSLAAMNNR